MKVIKIYSNTLLILTFALISLFTQRGLAITKSEAWLLNYAETVVLLNKINLSHVNGLKKCACYLQAKRGERLSPSCQPSWSREPEFISKAISISGPEVEEKFTCEEVIEGFVFRPLQRDLPTLRLSMALMKPEKLNLQHSNIFLSESFANYQIEQRSFSATTEYKINKNIAHEIKTFPWSPAIVKRQVRPLDQNEIATALRIYKKFSYDFCHSAIGKRRDAITAKLRDKDQAAYRNVTDEQICYNLIDSQKGLGVRTDFKEFLDEMYEFRNSKFRKAFKEKYAKLIQSNPLLVLLPSSRPSWTEIFKALSFIEKNAVERLAESTQRLKNRENLTEFVEYGFALDDAETRWKGRGLTSEQFEEIGSPIIEEFLKRKSRRQNIQLVGTLGVAIGCGLPWGRALGAALRLAKFSCLVGIGVPLNSYYMLSSVKQHQEAVNLLFSNVEAVKTLNKLDQANSSVDSFAFSAVLFPVGLNLAEAKQIPGLIKALAKN